MMESKGNMVGVCVRVFVCVYVRTCVRMWTQGSKQNTGLRRRTSSSLPFLVLSLLDNKHAHLSMDSEQYQNGWNEGPASEIWNRGSNYILLCCSYAIKSLKYFRFKKRKPFSQWSMNVKTSFIKMHMIRPSRKKLKII